MRRAFHVTLQAACGLHLQLSAALQSGVLVALKLIRSEHTSLHENPEAGDLYTTEAVYDGRRLHGQSLFVFGCFPWQLQVTF